MNAIDERLKSVVRKAFGLGASAGLQGVVYKEHPRWDSLGHIQLVLAVEKEFGVKFSSEQVVSMKTVDDVAAAVKRLLGRNP